MRMRFWKALGGLAAALLGVAALALALWLALSGGRLRKEPEGTLVRRVHVQTGAARTVSGEAGGAVRGAADGAVVPMPGMELYPAMPEEEPELREAAS